MKVEGGFGYLKNKMDIAMHKEMTDEETYQMLKSDRDSDMMDADEWKNLRLIELNRRGKSWSR